MNVTWMKRYNCFSDYTLNFWNKNGLVLTFEHRIALIGLIPIRCNTYRHESRQLCNVRMNASSFLRDAMTDVLKPAFTIHSELCMISADETTSRYATKGFSSLYTNLTVCILCCCVFYVDT
jgi:hypothetical protein